MYHIFNAQGVVSVIIEMFGGIIFLISNFGRNPMINIDKVKVYTDDVKIGPLNIDIPKAGITSFIGPNGAASLLPF